MADNPLIHLPGGGVHRFGATAPKAPPAPEYFEPYPDEYPKINRVFEWINQRFGHHSGEVTDKVKREFNAAAVTAFNDIGFEAHVEWFDLMNGEDYTGMSNPRIILDGRVKKEEEADHERIAWGVVRGMADGQPGYIDPNTGKLREDPKSKNIY